MESLPFYLNDQDDLTALRTSVAADSPDDKNTSVVSAYFEKKKSLPVFLSIDEVWETLTRSSHYRKPHALWLQNKPSFSCNIVSSNIYMYLLVVSHLKFHFLAFVCVGQVYVCCVCSILLAAMVILVFAPSC